MFIHTPTGKFPYSIEQLKKDNRNVSFPKDISDGIMARYGAVRVTEQEEPSYDPLTQKVVKATTATRETNGVYTEENAPSSEMVGEPIYTGRWVVEKTVVDLTTEEIAANNETTARSNRSMRNKILADSDWTQMNDSPLSNEDKTAWATYRQELRDVTDLDEWPNLEDADWPTKP